MNTPAEIELSDTLIRAQFVWIPPIGASAVINASLVAQYVETERAEFAA